MQTFLPYRSYKISAAVLDRLRLGKQRVECKQILSGLLGITSGWRNHPVTRMWEGYEQALAHYGMHCCNEWIARGYNDSCKPFFLAHITGRSFIRPPWHTHDRCLRYRALLLRKAPDHYRQYWPDQDDTLEMTYER
jgi:hypothetical protein